VEVQGTARKNVVKSAGAKRYSRPRDFNIAGASAPVADAVPTPLYRDRQKYKPESDITLNYKPNCEQTSAMVVSQRFRGANEGAGVQGRANVQSHATSNAVSRWDFTVRRSGKLLHRSTKTQ